MRVDELLTQEAGMETMTLSEFVAAIKGQHVPTEHVAFRCPVCKTIQSAADLIAAGAGEDFNAVERYVGYSCVGRWTDAGAHNPGEPPGRGCDWTLGGLFQFHELEVAEDGKRHPRFVPVSAEEAQLHRDEHDVLKHTGGQSR
jgi:hypothetical protein